MRRAARTCLAQRGEEIAHASLQSTDEHTLVVAGDDDHGRLVKVVSLVVDRIEGADEERV